MTEKYKESNLKVEKDAISRIKDDPKYFYTYSRKSDVGTLIGPEGELYSTSFQKAKCLQKQYESVYTQPAKEFNIVNPDIFFNVNSHCIEGRKEEVHECEEDRWLGLFVGEGCDTAAPEHLFVDGDSEDAYRRRNPTNPEKNEVYMDVVDAVKKIPNGAACGPDGVPPCLLKRGSTSVALMLTNILRHSFGEIPDILKLGLFSPIHKGGSTSNPAKFRPVALTSHIAKTGGRLIREQLIAHLEHIFKMDASQHGPRRGWSTLSQLLEHHDNIITMLENSMNVDSIYLNFAKAFDKCDIGIMMHKLKTLRIGGKLGKWLFNFLTKQKQQVVISGGEIQCYQCNLRGPARGSFRTHIISHLYI